ncbi:hypothetical protein MNEG_4405 [Monoraphidium neglectum]|uniref:Armadillo-like repeats domain-containing protein n=1 Tax=Monoraphidium neglectum TaxID=145388 RepID=A0A0D2MSZ0_9CHLO|nr:hypothetical protein MNEG_4405 [Monoraphidium neglectum]KIZ03552.1 hypothetical protein MNEG_4405 [Monoraphidium neglectum]|eukprot:XP_013902571.1 hypothetical protein MNEG_4405 [Monoraphidium neglectum]
MQRLSSSRGVLRGCAARTSLRPQALGRGLGADLGGKLGRAIAGGKQQGSEGSRNAEEAAPKRERTAAVATAPAAALQAPPPDDALAAVAAAPAAAGADAAAAAAAGAGAAGPADDGRAFVVEAVRQARRAAKPEVVEYEEIEIEEPVRGIADYAADARALLTAPATRKGLAFGAAALLGATFAVAVYRTWLKSNTVEAQRRRTVDRNKQLVQGLSQYLPDRRAELTPAVAKRLQRGSGFTPVEVFRKYLWYVLRERKFGPDAVADMVALKGALGLGDAEVAEALRERAQRIYDKYGTLILSTEGMSASGLQRKATCQALFSKMLYLTEHDPLVAHDSDAFKTTDLRLILGATDEDTDRLRIVSLVELDAERLDRLMAGDSSASPPGAAGGGDGSSSGGGGGGAESS